MKTYFFTGLAILLPLLITVFIILFFLRLLTQPFMGIAESLLTYYHISIPSFLFFSGQEFLRFLCQIAILIGLFLLTVFIGCIGEWYLVKIIFLYANSLFHKIPMINKVYKACQDVINNVMGPKKQSFGSVVLIPFPHKKILSIGLVTHEALVEEKDTKNDSDLISVFLPTTPNPTMGFVLMFPRRDLIFTKMGVEEALKSVISCGLMLPKIRPPQD